jgi:DNA repair protein RadC
VDDSTGTKSGAAAPSARTGEPRTEVSGPAVSEPPALFETQPRSTPGASPRRPSRDRSNPGGGASRALLARGAGALSDAELLAVILRGASGGGRAAEECARDALAARGGLEGLSNAGVFDLLEIPSLSESRAAAVLAAVELGKRLAERRGPRRPTISCPADVDALLRPRLAHLEQEHFVVLLLDTKNGVLASPTVAVGTLSSCVVHPREVFKLAVKAAAASVIVVHNHPSGHASPSREDREVTGRLAEAGKLLGMELLDHVIIGRAYLSMKESGHL